MSSDFGPCDVWPIQWTCDVPAESVAITGLIVSTATEILWALSGMQFGLCTVTLRPCRRECYSGPLWDEFGSAWSGTYPQPALIGGQWFNLVCGGCTGECTCTSLSEFALPAPVNRIVEIRLDGEPMVTGSYRLDNNRFVVRTDGGVWPLCNDLNLADTEPGTWSVTAVFGRELPEGAKLAMGALACELLRAAGGGDCNLPAGITQLIRQGVTIQYPDVGALFRSGRTGLYLVDAFLSAWNPYGLRQRSRVYDVDRPTVRRTNT